MSLTGNLTDKLAPKRVQETELSRGPKPVGRIEQRLGRSFSRAFFVNQLLQGDTARARAMGVDYAMLDCKLAMVAGLRICSQLFVFNQLARVPGVRDMADRVPVRRLNGLLERYGHAEFTSDGETYHARAA